MRLLAPSLLGLLLLVSVPADLHAEGEEPSIRALPVPAATIYPGQVIDASLLTERQFQTTPQSLAGVATEEAQVIGKETRRRLLAGKPIVLAGLTKPVLIRRGASGVASYSEDGFSISTQVTALTDGSAGDVIDARAMETGTVIKVRVSGNGELVVIGE